VSKDVGSKPGKTGYWWHKRHTETRPPNQARRLRCHRKRYASHPFSPGTGAGVAEQTSYKQADPFIPAESENLTVDKGIRGFFRVRFRGRTDVARGPWSAGGQCDNLAGGKGVQ
jgi:hypothetical protein